MIIIPIKWLFHWEYTQHFPSGICITVSAGFQDCRRWIRRIGRDRWRDAQPWPVQLFLTPWVTTQRVDEHFQHTNRPTESINVWPLSSSFLIYGRIFTNIFALASKAGEGTNQSCDMSLPRIGEIMLTLGEVLCKEWDMGVSENVVYPFLPNGFADHYPVFKWLFHWED